MMQIFIPEVCVSNW